MLAVTQRHSFDEANQPECSPRARLLSLLTAPCSNGDTPKAPLSADVAYGRTLMMETGAQRTDPKSTSYSTSLYRSRMNPNPVGTGRTFPRVPTSLQQPVPIISIKVNVAKLLFFTIQRHANQVRHRYTVYGFQDVCVYPIRNFLP